MEKVFPVEYWLVVTILFIPVVQPIVASGLGIEAREYLLGKQ